jgi:hypothetical protein
VRERVLIACDVLRSELSALAPDVPFELLPGSLHFRRDELHETLSDRIAALPAGVTVLLGYGRCVLGAGGLEAGSHRLVLPAVDNCVALLLGSELAYLEDLKRCPRALYYTPGWTAGMDDPYTMYLRAVERLGREAAERWAALVFGGYSQVTFVRSGAQNEEACRRHLDGVLACSGLPLETRQGSLRLLEKLLHGPHDDEFVVARPGEMLEEAAFWRRTRRADAVPATC